MIGYLSGRAAALLATLVAASVVVFALTNLLPGDPAALMMGLNADPEALQALRTELGLDAPAWRRYLDWVGGMLTGDFGLSYTYRAPVADLMAERAAVSIPLAIMALILSTAVALGLALLSVSQRGRVGETVIGIAAQVGVAAPNFWVALLLVYVFSTLLGWFGAGGFPGWSAGLGPAFAALALPALALALPQAAILTRVARSALIDTLNEDYIRTARAKGAGPWRTLIGHALPNALIPILTLLGLQFSFLLAGAVIIETVFYLPGLGRLVLQAVAQRDLIVVQGVVMALVAATVVVTFLVDILYAAADPRLRTARAAP